MVDARVVALVTGIVIVLSFQAVRVLAGAAAHEPLRQDRSTLAAAPFLFTHAVIFVAKDRE